MSRHDTATRSASRPWLKQALEVVGVLPLFAVSPLMRPWHLRWGSTPTEVAAPMPGDEVVPDAQFTATRAITIAAPPEDVWPWLVQVGFGRAGFYSYDLLDSLGRPSADTVIHEWQHPHVGDMAAPMTGAPTSETSFVLAEASAPHLLLWTKPDSTWAWRLTAVPEGTRLVTRLKQRYRATPRGLLTVALLELGDFPMMRKMLLGIRDRAEHLERPLPAPSAQPNAPWTTQPAPVPERLST